MKAIMIFILFVGFTIAQDNPIPKAYPSAVRLTWDADTSGTIAEYMIFYIQGEDTADFDGIGFKDGANYDDIWDWWIGSSLYEFYYVKIKADLYPVVSYVRIGVIGLKYDGTFTPLKCISKVLKVKPGARIQNVKVD